MRLKHHTLLCFLFFACIPFTTNAATLEFVKDVISTSAPSTSSNHTITFQTVQAIPASGKIILTPDAGFFISENFDYADVDLATAATSTGPYTDRSLAATASAANDGVNVATGTAGFVAITLNSSSGIGAGIVVQVELGIHASFGTSGVDQIVNPASARSYSFRIETQTSSGGALDALNAKVAIVNTVSMGPVNTKDFDPPILSNGMPSGSSIAAGILQVEISLSTDEWATCRYATVSSIPYLSMTSTFAVTGQFFHSTSVGSLSNGKTFYYFVRCQDYRNNANTTDYIIYFSVQNPLPAPGPGGGLGPGVGGGGGINDVLGGVPSGSPYPPGPTDPQVRLEGFAYPKSTVTILKDGKTESEVATDVSGKFAFGFSVLPQGLYTFGLWAKDSAGRRSITFSSTFGVIAGTKTLVANILLPPTMEVKNKILTKGAPIEVFGDSAPASVVEVELTPQIFGDTVFPEEILRKQTVADTGGLWRLAMDTQDLIWETYSIRARASLPQSGFSIFGEIITVGTAQSLDLRLRSDINRDGRVNFVDFSILLFNWGKQNPQADINSDGKINLADFSIMLTNWTG